MGHDFLGIQYYLLSVQEVLSNIFQYFTVCPKNLDPFYIITYYINWIKTFWTYRNIHHSLLLLHASCQTFPIDPKFWKLLFMGVFDGARVERSDGLKLG